MRMEMSREVYTQETKVLLRKCEVKRTLDKLSKRELCIAIGISYHHYCNTLNGSDLLSLKTFDILEDYLKMQFEDVWLKLARNKKMKIEKYNAYLDIDVEMVESCEDVQALYKTIATM